MEGVFFAVGVAAAARGGVACCVVGVAPEGGASVFTPWPFTTGTTCARAAKFVRLYTAFPCGLAGPDDVLLAALSSAANMPVSSPSPPAFPPPLDGWGMPAAPRPRPRPLTPAPENGRAACPCGSARAALVAGACRLIFFFFF